MTEYITTLYSQVVIKSCENLSLVMQSQYCWVIISVYQKEYKSNEPFCSMCGILFVMCGSIVLPPRPHANRSSALSPAIGLLSNNTSLHSHKCPTKRHINEYWIAADWKILLSFPTMLTAQQQLNTVNERACILQKFHPSNSITWSPN